ncbi:MAG: HEPN domain-containing protein [Desulfuromonadales bacterium]|nr:HEPN domain-containing protein [Desulfuromonadales bacterium]
MMKSGFAFVFTHIDYEGDLPVEIIPDHFFRRAKTKETESIRNLLSKSAYPHFGWSIAYEHTIKEEKTGDRTNYHREPLTPRMWKYWVIAFNGNNHEIHKLEYAAQLIEHDLDFGFYCLFNEENQQGDWVGNSYLPMHLVERYNCFDEAARNAVKINCDELSSLGAYYRKIKNLPEQFNFIDHSIKNFYELKKIPRRSDLLVVGYFSIVEALITHEPRLNESLDSISHQVRNKIALLKKKFRRDISEDNYFLPGNEGKIWKKLYAYRSCVAHGSIPDFMGTLQVLKSGEIVNEFLKETIKELLVLAIHEPEFLEDLKRC